MQQLTELGFYGLAGHSNQPRGLIGEIQQAEELGLGSIFLSERFNLKDAGVMTGASCAASRTLGIATGATNFPTRHPMVTATMSTTAHRMSGGRFCLGLGRGIDALFDVMGVKRVTSDQLDHAMELLRQMWHGETLFAPEGPAGSWPMLFQDSSFNEEIPILLTAMGLKSLERAGATADAIVLHTFFSDEATADSVAAVRRGAEKAGKDPASVRVWSVLATVGDHLPHELQRKKLVGRLATYLQGYGDLLVRVNNWDPAQLQAFREHPLVTGFSGAFDAVATVDQLDQLAEIIPPSWLESAATGSPQQCAATVAAQFDLGVDSVIMHGATPEELAPVVEAYRQLGRASELPVNPGWMPSTVPA